MSKYLQYFLFLSIGLVLGNLKQLSFDSNDKQKVDYVVGILSSRDHFQTREIIRKTWLSKINDLNFVIKPYFIIGKQSCNLTMKLRTDQYDCNEIKLNESFSRTDFYANRLIESNSLKQPFFEKEINFEVLFDLTITRFGILNCFLKNSDHFKIALLDQNEKVSCF